VQLFTVDCKLLSNGITLLKDVLINLLHFSGSFKRQLLRIVNFLI
jgi:hypothetical protein